MDSQYKLLSELLSDQAAFITSPKTSLANYWGGGAVSTSLNSFNKLLFPTTLPTLFVTANLVTKISTCKELPFLGTRLF